MKAVLVLEDGMSFEGIAHGAKGHAFGEIVFNTSMTGYQEIITDPSYSGQLVTFTHPHIGNYGVCQADMESDSAKVSGVIVREMTEFPSSHRSEASLPAWLEEQGVEITGIKTMFPLNYKMRDSSLTILLTHLQDMKSLLAMERIQFIQVHFGWEERTLTDS